MTFFEYIKTEKGKNTFYLPLPLSDLADYLSVDRSAMMREIKKMNGGKYYNLRKTKNHSHRRFVRMTYNIYMYKKHKKQKI